MGWSGTLPSRLGSDGAGIVVIDRSRKILFRNRAAESVLQSNGALMERHERLASDLAAVEARLRMAMTPQPDACASHSGPQVLSLPRTSGPPLLGLLVPLPLGDSRERGALLLFWEPESVTPVPAAMLQQLFGLTPSEALTALEAYAGETPTEIAGRRRRSVATIRTLLGRVFSKCGVKRQAELIRLLAGIGSACSLAEGISVGIRMQQLDGERNGARAVSHEPRHAAAGKVLSSDDLQTLVRTKEFAPSTGTPLHYQTQGHEVVCVMRGEMITSFGWGEVRATSRGEAIYLGDNILHRGHNPSSRSSAQVLVINVIQRGRPFGIETAARQG